VSATPRRSYSRQRAGRRSAADSGPCSRCSRWSGISAAHPLPAWRVDLPAPRARHLRDFRVAVWLSSCRPPSWAFSSKCRSSAVRTGLALEGDGFELRFPATVKLVVARFVPPVARDGLALPSGGTVVVQPIIWVSGSIPRQTRKTPVAQLDSLSDFNEARAGGGDPAAPQQMAPACPSA
jgi:hypothetical protein